MNRTALFTLAFFALVTATASAALITDVSETGTGLSTAGVYYTGQNFDHPIEGEDFDIPALDEDVPFFTDRNHEYNGTSAENTIASLGLVGAEYIMMANDNRSVGDYLLNVEISQTVDAYVMMDSRVTQPAWLTSDGWMNLGAQRMGIDEGGNGTGPGDNIQNTFYIWKKTDIADSFVTRERGGTGNNMYGVVVTEPGIGPDYVEPPPPPTPVDFSYEQIDATTGSGTVSLTFDARKYGGSDILTLSADMPAATVTGDAPTVPTAIGYIDGTGEDNGVHIGWSGSVSLTATDGDDVWSIEVPLTIPDPNIGSYHWELSFEDNHPVDGGDAFGSLREAAYVGDFSNGHRHTGSTRTYVEGAKDSFTYSKNQNLGSDARGDNLGINMAIRSGDFGAGSAGLNVENMVFEGILPGIELLLNGERPVAVAPDPLPLEPFSVVLDIGPKGQRVQTGHIAVPLLGAPGSGSNGANLDESLIDTGTGLITFSLDNTNQAGAGTGNIDWRDRGNNGVNPDDDLVAMGEDFIKNNDGIVRVVLGNLPAGTYSAISYHADADNDQSEAIQILVDNGDGSGYVDTLVLGSANLGVPDVNGLVNGVDDLTTAIMAGTSASFTFVADGVNPVAIIFDGTAATDTEVPLSGLSITYVPEPSTLAMLAAVAMTALLVWRRRR